MKIAQSGNYSQAATKKSLKKRAARLTGGLGVGIVTIEPRKSMPRRSSPVLEASSERVTVPRREKGGREGQGEIRMPRKYREHNNQK